MGAKKAAEAVQRAAEIDRERLVEDALHAIALRRTGTGWGVIARQMGRSIVQVQELAKVGYESLLGVQDVEQLRAEVEDRYDAVVRQANLDLALAETVAERQACLRTILAAEAARVRLLGLAARPEKEATDAGDQ